MRFLDRLLGRRAAHEDFASLRYRVLEEAVSKGHEDSESLRELLIATTSKDTIEAAMEYFGQHLHDEELLSSLFEIAAEGEDMGDAPWAAANLIAEFPPELLSGHRQKLEELANHPWVYLHGPARRALATIPESGNSELK